MTSRAQILRIARSGLSDRAWAVFQASGWSRRTDPEALTLKGRLLKDMALAAAAPQRTALLMDAAASYAEAAEAGPSTYALINAATLSLMAGDVDAARVRAQRVQALLASGAHEPDTAYWLAATRAEAKLVMGDVAAARTCLGEAIATAPRAWEDHATTLRQFAVILGQLREDADWLEDYRPPPVVHYRGLMRLTDSEAAERLVAGAVQDIRPAAAFGALAAGADILIAEAVLDVGADLHLVLPCDVDLFRAESVDVAGAGWAARYDRLVENAAEITIAARPERLFEAAVRHADEVAMGMAAARSGALQTAAIGLRLDPEAGEDWGQSADEKWTAGGRRITSLTTTASPQSYSLAESAGQQVCALLSVRDRSVERLEAAGGRALDHDRRTGAVWAFPTLDEALAAVCHLPPGVAAGLDYCPVSTSAIEERDSVFALEALHAAEEGQVYATSRAAAVACLHGVQSAPLGSVLTPYGETDICVLGLNRTEN